MQLNLISCNIRFDNPADAQNAWAHRRGFLAETLLSHSPDLIATQEGRIHQLREFEADLVNFKILDQHRSWIGERMYPSIFIREDKFEYLNSGDIWLSETPDIAGSRSFESAFPRLMTWAHLQFKNSEQSIFVVNTHLDHIKAETRIRQAEVLVNEIERQWNRNCPLIIMGDFNESPEGEVKELLFHKFELNDCWKQFHSHEETSHHAFQGEMQNGSRIDWILADKKLSILSCEMDKSEKNGLYPTDHFPVICELSI